MLGQRSGRAAGGSAEQLAPTGGQGYDVDELVLPGHRDADYPFIVRVFPSDASQPPVDITREAGIDTAIVGARNLAIDPVLHYRSVMVTDDRSMVWAQFNMLWTLAEER